MNKMNVKGYRRLIMGIGLGLYLKFMLLPTATAFYELYHLTGINFIYWGYSLFKVAGYYFGIWSYQIIACIAVAVFVVVPWREAVRYLKPRSTQAER